LLRILPSPPTHPPVYCSAIISRQDIDDLNILQATMTGMRQAVQGLATRPGALLVDGNRIPTGLEEYAVKAVVGGDAKSVAIAAASVLAKVSWDSWDKL
jgi:ribonuclease HII